MLITVEPLITDTPDKGRPLYKDISQSPREDNVFIIQRLHCTLTSQIHDPYFCMHPSFFIQGGVFFCEDVAPMMAAGATSVELAFCQRGDSCEVADSFFYVKPVISIIGRLYCNTVEPPSNGQIKTKVDPPKCGLPETKKNKKLLYQAFFSLLKQGHLSNQDHFLLPPNMSMYILGFSKKWS